MLHDPSEFQIQGHSTPSAVEFPGTTLVQPGPDAAKLTNFITLPHASHTG